MPKNASTESLADFVRRQPADTLADLLLELAAERDDVRTRLERLALSDQPKALAAAFRKPLAGWKRATRFLGYAEARAFGRELEQWLDQIERELMPQDPALALDLAEAFVLADAKFFERADDSDGAVGDAVRAGCRLWLRCAAGCEAPVSQWPARIAALFDADAVGARDEFLRRADLLLDAAGLQELVETYEQRLDALLADGSHACGRPLPTGVFNLSAALSLLSEALRDPDIHVRAVLRYSPQPNPVQKEAFVRAYLDANRPADALRWLEGGWGSAEASRMHLQAQALQRLGRTKEAAALRQQIFESTLALHDLQAWLGLLPPGAQAKAVAQARVLALERDDPVAAATVLLELGDDAQAERILVQSPNKLRSAGYGPLLPLAKALEQRQLWAGATIVYRDLLLDILERASTPAYRHGASYWNRLQQLAGACSGLSLTPTPAAFEAEVRLRHGRKSSFWALVDGTGRKGTA